MNLRKELALAQTAMKKLEKEYTAKKRISKFNFPKY